MKSSMFITAVLWFSTPVLASTIGSGKHLKVELISEQKIIESGKPAFVGLKFDLDPGWHVYWENPGDSGIPPKIQWTLPQGVLAHEIIWPTPEKINIPPLADYGYEKEVLFIIPIQVQPTVPKGPLLLKGLVKWLVCKQVCIPGEAQVDLKIAVGDTAVVNSRWSSLFEATRLSVPKPRPLNMRLLTSTDADHFVFQIELPEQIKAAQFFSRAQSQVDNPAVQKFVPNSKGGTLTIKKADQLASDPKMVSGILQIQTGSSVSNYDIENPVEVAASNGTSWLNMLLLAFVGGLILNLMPCVFPVLSMKVFGFLKSHGEERKHIRAHALFYTLGILISFWILVGVLLSLKAGGEKLGWGFQLQSPGFVGFLSGVLFLFGLSLIGVFDIGSSFAGVGNRFTRLSGNTGAFFTGVLATIVSTPCTAPFMGAAVGFALSQPPLICFMIFTALALGLALPYVALSLIPALGRLLPRPGAWMETVKQITAFLIFATAIWLLWVLSIETGANYLVIILIGFLSLSVSAWLFHRWPQKRVAQVFGILLVVATLALIVIEAPSTTALAQSAQSAPVTAKGADELNWEEFSPAKVAEYRKAGKNVFVDFTAAWCVSCKVNELVVFRSQEVKSKIVEKNLALLKADWTNHNEEISEALKNLGRSGVPAYALFEKNSDASPILLPEVITPGIVLSALDQLH